MNEHQQVLLLIRGTIASLPADNQTKIAAAYAKIQAIETEYGDYARVAIGLRGAELAAAGETE